MITADYVLDLSPVCNDCVCMFNQYIQERLTLTCLIILHVILRFINMYLHKHKHLKKNTENVFI